MWNLLHLVSSDGLLEISTNREGGLSPVSQVIRGVCADVCPRGERVGWSTGYLYNSCKYLKFESKQEHIFTVYKCIFIRDSHIYVYIYCLFRFDFLKN